MRSKKHVFTVFLLFSLLTSLNVLGTQEDVATAIKRVKKTHEPRVKTKQQALPQKKANTIDSPKSTTKTKLPRLEFPTLVEWTARCLSQDEMLSGSVWRLKPILPVKEFTTILNVFLKKFKEKGILEQLEIPNHQNTTDVEDFRYPYVTTIDADNDTVICFTGDLHGSIHSLLRNLWRLVALGYLDKSFKILKKNCYLIFLGDYTDRGRYGSEVLYTLLRLKITNWGRVYLVRGNHEVKSMNEQPASSGGGFWDELKAKYHKSASSIFANIGHVYQRMPLAVFVTANEQTIKAVHGGLGPHGYYYDVHHKNTSPKTRKRYHHIPLKGNELISPAFQWCDVTQTAQKGSINGFTPDSGRVWRIDTSTLLKQITRANIKALFRGHQHGSFGFKMLFDQATYQELVNSAKGRDSHSSLYHWTRVIQKVAPNDIQENQKHGFKIGKYVPLFTFSSAPEGVWGNHDCLGLLFTNGLYEDWRLKIYEFEAPMATTSEQEKAHLMDKPFFTVIKKASPKQIKKGSADIADPIQVNFSSQKKPPLSEQALRALLNQI